MGKANPYRKKCWSSCCKTAPKLELDAEQGDLNSDMATYAQNIMKEAGAPPPNAKPGQGYGQLMGNEDPGGELDSKEPKTFVYDEWDFRAADYRPRWCVVKERKRR